MPSLRFSILGPLEVRRDDVDVPLGPPKQRAVLARLLLADGLPVEADRLADDVWEGTPPRAAAASLQAYIAKLRRALEPERPAGSASTVLTTRGSAYQLAADELDAREFERLAADAAAHLTANEPGEAVAAADAALALWRGDVLADLADHEFVRAEATRLGQRRLTLVEDRAQAALDLGDTSVADDLQSLAQAHPLRERTWYLLILALYRAGRTADSLDAYHRVRARLADDLGLEPGGALQDLHTAILRQDPVLGQLPPIHVSAEPRTTPALSHGLERAPLPTPQTPIIGRDDDLAAVEALLDATRCVTVVGPGGVGKSRLALEVAARRADLGDDVVFVPLAPVTDPGLVVPAVAAAFGLSESAGTDPQSLLRATLQHRPTLAVLDNLEHLLATAPALSTLLETCPGLRLLVTSRAPLRIAGEREHHLAPLAVPTLDDVPSAAQVADVAAAELFVSRATAHAPRFALTDRNAAAIAAICRRLDGLPLALELAAVWLRMLTPATLLARLDDTLPLLADGARDLPDRQRTMRGVVAWSYDLLEDPERRLLEALSVFHGGWTLDDALAVAGMEEGLLHRHARLLEVSLVQRALTSGEDDEPRFTMLETIRVFATERLVASGDAAALRARHATHLRAVAVHAGQGLTGAEQRRWLDFIDDRLADLHAAYRWYLDTGDGEGAADILWSIRYFLYVRGHLTEGCRWVAVGVDSGALAGRSLARVLAVSGLMRFILGEWADATDDLDRALEMADDDETLAFASSVRGHACIGTDDLTAAVAFAEQAIERYRALDDHTGMGVTTIVLFHAAVVAGEVARAVELLDEAEQHLRRAGGPWGLAFVLNLRVMTAQMTGRGREVLDVQRESLRLSRQVQDTAVLFFGLTGMAELLVEVGDLEDAARLFGAVERLQERVGTVMQNEVNRWLYQHHVDLLRERLPDDDVHRGWGEGRALDLDAAIELALRPAAEEAAELGGLPGLRASSPRAVRATRPP